MIHTESDRKTEQQEDDITIMQSALSPQVLALIVCRSFGSRVSRHSSFHSPTCALFFYSGLSLLLGNTARSLLSLS
jgi:hypothetical protein